MAILLSVFALQIPLSRAAGRCESLLQLSLPSVVITSATVISSGTFSELPSEPASGKTHARLPPYCRVVGVSTPVSKSTIGFQVWLPLQGWSHRLHMVGNGGYGSNIYYAQMSARIRAHDTAVATDTGHRGDTLAFGIDNPEAIVDWGHRAVHETLMAARGVAARFYESPPRWSYFSGCSTGGMQALSEAQRYPADFDGIIAGDPGNNRTGLTLSFLWAFQHNHRSGDDVHEIVPSAKLLLVHKKTLEACDALDGVRDGVINDPRLCHFDVQTLRCAREDNEQCLTSEQIEFFHAMYSGPRDMRNGHSIYPGFPPGSEGVIVDPGQPLPGWSEYWANPDRPREPQRVDLLRYWAFHDGNWDWRQFDWGAAVDAVSARIGPAVDATSPDLAAFRTRGGRLILFMGWEDPVGSSLEAIEYYQQVVEQARGESLEARRAATLAFARLFMVPGMGHCAGGPGATNFSTATRDSTPPISDARHDMAVALQDWVEHGVAPDTLVATRYVDQSQRAIAFQRPLCAYPKSARYVGGDSRQANSFRCVNPLSSGGNP
ncbi:MAG: Chlorogenate esterase [Gammaproteobacteria bacterium]|nr:Chlorogenate esterase [Gammaproteobacteria bacterium]